MPDNTVTVVVKNVLWLSSNQAEVILENGAKNFSLYTSLYEGTAIARLLREEKTRRPMTHDFFLSVMAKLGERITRVVITKIQDDAYIGALTITDKEGKEHVFDCRPSDMIALAIPTKVPIEVVETVFQEAVNAPARLTVEFLIEGEGKP